MSDWWVSLAPGYVKILCRKGTEEIVGATIVAEHAGEMSLRPSSFFLWWPSVDMDSFMMERRDSKDA